MRKKKHKKQNKQKDISHIRCHELAEEQVGNELLERYSGQTMTVEFTYEGKIYKGTIPCVGVSE